MTLEEIFFRELSMELEFRYGLDFSLSLDRSLSEVCLGIIAGYYGRWIDTIISRIFDIMLAFPSILLAIAIVSVLRSESCKMHLIAIAIINVPNFGRLIRSKVLSIKEDEYITAAKGIGMKDARILFSHILPNSMAPVIVQGTLAIATAILEAAALGFLGLGCTSAACLSGGKCLRIQRTIFSQPRGQ